jgi:hypothetical protein
MLFIDLEGVDEQMVALLAVTLQRKKSILEPSIVEVGPAKAVSQQVTDECVCTLGINEIKRELQGTQRKLQNLLDGTP